MLYSDITAMCNVKGYCSAGNEHFADKFKQSKRTVSGTIARLAELGYLRVEVIRDVGKTVVERRIWVQANAQEAMEKVAGPIEENFHTYRKKLPDPIEENFQDIKENNTRDNNNPLTPTGESELFDEFWAAYPKHVAKKPARAGVGQAPRRPRPAGRAFDRARVADAHGGVAAGRRPLRTEPGNMA